MEKKIPFRMRRKNLENLPEVIMPAGYSIRIFKDGEEKEWCDIINKTCETNFDAEKFNSEFKQNPAFSPGRIFFIEFENKLIGTATAWVEKPDEKVTGLIHWVGVLPEHRGKKLGYLIALQALHYMREHGFKDVVLNTANSRPAAIKTYLKLGFEPEIVEDAQREAWTEVFRNIGIEEKGEK